MKQTLFILAVLTIIFTGCKKEDDSNNNTTGTCTDGIKNQGETGIDCGGPCTACPVSLCADGILNQGETDIDCGGPCSACPTSYLHGLLGTEVIHVSGSNGTYLGDDFWWPYNVYSHLHLEAGGVWMSGFSTIAQVTIHKNLMNYGGSSNSAATYLIYVPGTYGIYKYEVSNVDSAEGGRIQVKDNNGVVWDSSPGDNTGSTFTITERGTYNGSFSTYTTFKGNFSCKMYDDSGHQKIFTGSFSSYAGL